MAETLTKPIFGSLGSNYSASFAFQTLWSWVSADQNQVEKLKHALTKIWPGKEILLTAKGRDSLELALRGLDIGVGEWVLTQAFSCVAVEEAIIRAGARPVYYDLAEKSLTPSVETLEAARQKIIKQGVPTQQIQGLVLQFTLGYVPAELDKIKAWADLHKLKIIADLAQAVGANDQQGNLLGLDADAVVLSFGRDKVLDAVNGGAVIFRKQPKKDLDKFLETDRSMLGEFKDASYPVLSWLVRQTFSFGIGKLLIKLFKLSGWWSSPVVADHNRPHSLSPFHSELVLKRLTTWKNELKHRREIAQIYHQKLSQYAPITDQGIEQGTNLRYPILVDNPAKLLRRLEKSNVYISDRWYRSPVDSGSFNRPTVYTSGLCPQAEELAKHVINLPTHTNITPRQASQLADDCQTFLSFPPR